MNIFDQISGTGDTYSNAVSAMSLQEQADSMDHELTFKNTMEGIDEHIDGIDKVVREIDRIDAIRKVAVNTIEETSDYAAVVAMTNSLVLEAAASVGIPLGSSGYTLENLSDYVTHSEARKGINTIEGIRETAVSGVLKACRILMTAIKKAWRAVVSLVHSKEKQVIALQTKAKSMNSGSFEKKSDQFLNESIGRNWAVKGTYDFNNISKVLGTTYALLGSVGKMSKVFENAASKVGEVDSEDSSAKQFNKIFSPVATSILDGWSSMHKDEKIKDNVKIVSISGFVNDKVVKVETSTDTAIAASIRFSVKSVKDKGVTTDSSINVESLSDLISVCGDLLRLSAAVDQAKNIEKDISKFESTIENALKGFAAGASDSNKDTARAASRGLSILSQTYGSVFKSAPSIGSETLSAGLFFVAAQLGQYKKA